MSRLASLLAFALPVAACSLIVGGEDEPLRCSQEGQLGAPACDAGWVCHGGLCEVPEAGGAPSAGAPGVSVAGGSSGQSGGGAAGAAASRSE